MIARAIPLKTDSMTLRNWAPSKESGNNQEAESGSEEGGYNQKAESGSIGGDPVDSVA